MPNLSIKNVPDEVVEKLRQRAAGNHRSLQGELMALVCSAVSKQRSGSKLEETETGWKSVDQILKDRKADYPGTFSEGPLSVDIIRAERDSR